MLMLFNIMSPFIRALKEFELVEEGDRIAIAISGGKDSLLLSKLFQELRRASKTNFKLVFISMNPGFNDINLQNLKKNLDYLEIPCEIYNDTDRVYGPSPYRTELPHRGIGLHYTIPVGKRFRLSCTLWRQRYRCFQGKMDLYRNRTASFASLRFFSHSSKAVAAA